MLTDIQRAAMMPNPAGTAWFHHIRARYAGVSTTVWSETQIALEIQQFTALAGAHAEFSGLIESGKPGNLPIVTEVHGALDLENRDLRFETAQTAAGADIYTGRFSENGRVLDLRAKAASGKVRELRLVHEPTLHELFAE